MATTDARTGFRLPWSAEDRAPSDAAEMADDGAPAAGWPVADLGARLDADAAEILGQPATESGAPAAVEPAAPTRSQRAKPSKFLADLTKAMQATAEAAREEVLARLQADAKTHIEQIHGLAADEATSLRRRADDDVAAVREWSKVEIARIREETEQRITGRKSRLEHEIEDNAALIERRIERVQRAVDAFEAEMAIFFERLLLEEDPSQFATMAENLPEPPPLTFDPDAADETDAEVDGMMPAAEVASEPVDAPDADAPAVDEPFEATLETPDAGAGETVDPGASQADAPAIETDGPFTDPRIAVLGLTPDSAAAAEAEAFAAVDDAEGEEIPLIADDALAARLADLVPDQETTSGAPATTDIVVVGLVSVASIASFKRHLSRLPGVHAVGVTSGPDGEFIFAVTHEPEVSLHDAIPALPSFRARVTGAEDTSLTVTAHDPETDA